MLTVTKELRFQCNLKKIMEDRDLNPTQLHRLTKVSLTTIRSMTNGGTLDRIDRGSTEKILSNLGCNFSDLWRVDWQEVD